MTKKAKGSRYLARDLKSLHILLKNSAEGFDSENAPQNLGVEQSSHIVKIGVEATC